MGLTVAVGDIHGMADKLGRLLGKVEDWLTLQGAGFAPRFVFLGDYIDRGPDSRAVVGEMRRMQLRGAICLRGNHEQMMIDSSRSSLDEQNFLLNGGRATRASFGAADQFAAAQEWMKALPTFHEDELRYFVHAGVRPGIPFESQTDEDRLWIRGDFLHSGAAFPKYVVHGHTPTISVDPDQTTPDIRDNRCNLDTGAGWGAALSAAIFDDRQRKPIHTISVV